MAKIVFCEDEERIQKLITATLRSTPHEIFIAGNGIEGAALIERERPDLIFTDISMPQCDGIQMTDTIKTNPQLAHIPVIFLTAFAQSSEVEDGYQHGATSYLTKPFSPSELRAKVESCLKN